jgi:hypothetical protein
MLPWVWVILVPALYLGRGVSVQSRFLLPLLPVLSWLAWRAGECWSLGATPTPRAVRRTVLIGTTLAVLVLMQNLVIYGGRVLPVARASRAGVPGTLVTWGRWLGEHTPERSSIATPDIGALGYFSRRRIVDLSGLVTPQMLPYLDREAPGDAIANFRFATFARPDFIVDHAPRPDDLKRRSRYASALTLLAVATASDPGTALPGPCYSLYRVDWVVADSLGAPTHVNGPDL